MWSVVDHTISFQNTCIVSIFSDFKSYLFHGSKCASIIYISVLFTKSEASKSIDIDLETFHYLIVISYMHTKSIQLRCSIRGTMFRPHLRGNMVKTHPPPRSKCKVFVLLLQTLLTLTIYILFNFTHKTYLKYYPVNLVFSYKTLFE